MTYYNTSVLAACTCWATITYRNSCVSAHLHYKPQASLITAGTARYHAIPGFPWEQGGSPWKLTPALLITPEQHNRISFVTVHHHSTAKHCSAGKSSSLPSPPSHPFVALWSTHHSCCLPQELPSSVSSGTFCLGVQDGKEEDKYYLITHNYYGKLFWT